MERVCKVKPLNFPMRILFCLFFVLIFTRSALYAQFNACIDSTSIYTAPCPPPDTIYEPLCGCNNVTYNNLCDLNQARVLNYLPGPCEEIVIHSLFPNPTSSEITYRIVLNQQETITIVIYDEFGKLQYSQDYQDVYDETFTTDMTSLRSGVYIMVAYATNHFSYKKFVKY